MLDTTFNEIADLALRHSGQAFQPSRSYLMEARLSAICRRESFASLDELAHCLKARPNLRFEKEVAAALTTKLTRFFGDRDVLERIVTHALPDRLKASKTGRLRIWCAGCSTGQEVWSLAIRLSELAQSPLKGAQIELLGTDLSAECIEAARQATYGHYDVQTGLSIQRLIANFNRRDTGDWSLRDDLRERVKFEQHNLIEDARALGQFDIIICRNVLTGMSAAMRTQASASLMRQLAPGGMIFTSARESLGGLVDGLNPSRDLRGAFVRDTNSGSVAAA